MNGNATGQLDHNLGAETWRQIVDSAVDTGIISTDVQGRVTSWNEGARRILGWTADEMFGQPLDRLFPGDSGAEAIALDLVCVQ